MPCIFLALSACNDPQNSASSGIAPNGPSSKGAAAEAPAPKKAPAHTTPFRAGVFACIETARGGVKYNDEARHWEGVAFQVQKFVVRADFVRQRTVFGKPGDPPAIIGADYRVTMTSPGPEPRSERHPCAVLGGESEFVAVVSNTEIICRAQAYELTLNIRNGRFVLTNQAGFADGRDAGASELSVSVGTCTQSGN